MKRQSLGASTYTLLKTLNTYTSRFEVKVRVVDKGPLSTFSNRRTNKPGAVFSCTVIDSEGTQINCKFWNDVASTYYERIEKGKVYTMAKGRINVANKRYSNGVDHNYELSFESSDADIKEVEADADVPADDIPLQRNLTYTNLRSIELSTRTLPYICHLVGVCHDISAIRNIQLKTGESSVVRTLTLVDPTQYSIEIAIWGHTTNSIVFNVGDVLALVNVQVRQGRNQQGFQGSTLRSSEINVNNHPDTDELKKWYNGVSNIDSFTPLTPAFESQRASTGAAVINTDLRGMLNKIQTDGVPDAGIVFRIMNASVASLVYRNPREDDKIVFLYDACKTCNKKIPADGSCPSCFKNDATPKMTLQSILADYSASNVPVRVFNDAAQIILERTPHQIQQVINNPQQITELCEYLPLWNRFTFLIRARKDVYNNQIRISYVITSVQPLQPQADAAYALEKLTQLLPDFHIATEYPAKRAVSEADDFTAKRIKVNDPQN